MARVVKICVVDSNGYGLSGQKVKSYGGSEFRTDSDGYVKLTLDGSRTTIYVNGHTAYDGYVANLDPVETFTKSGGRL